MTVQGGTIGRSYDWLVPVATVSDYETYIGEAAAADVDEDQAQMVINFLAGEMELFLMSTLSPTEYTESYVLNLADPTIHFRTTPVVSVASVVDQDNNTVQAQLYTVQRWGIDLAGYANLLLSDPVIWTPTFSSFVWHQSPDIYALASGAYPQAVWTITYTSALADADVNRANSILMEATRRRLSRLGSGVDDIVSSIKVEDYSLAQSERVLTMMQAGFTAGEIMILDNMRKKRPS